MDSVHYWYQKIFSSFLKDTELSVFVNDKFLENYPYYQFTPIDNSTHSCKGSLVFFDQEPMYRHFLQDLRSRINAVDESVLWAIDYSTKKIIVTSEKSAIIDHFCRAWKFRPIYYFFHGFATLDWYRNHWKEDINVNFEHKYLFVSFQHLVNHKRAHRVDLLCRLHEKGLTDHGLISFQRPENLDDIISENLDFTDESRELYHRHKHNLKTMFIDTTEPTGALSTSINIPAAQSAFLQIVTETVYYGEKLHLTEKVFKPIVCKQPFLLLAAPGNLNFLKSYGFKTFSEYWDESYDQIQDPGQRVQAVVNIVADLARRSSYELVDMKKDMANILDFNHEHFYHDFKYIIADEFVTNTKQVFNDLKIEVSADRWKKLYKMLTF